MKLNHIALVCTSQENARIFYQKILGLENLYSFVVPKVLSKEIFGFDKDIKILKLGNKNLTLEIFLVDKKHLSQSTFEHVCIEVDDRENLIKRCKEENLKIIKIEREKGFTLFIRDFDRNFFEIKEKTSG